MKAKGTNLRSSHPNGTPSDLHSPAGNKSLPFKTFSAKYSGAILLTCEKTDSFHSGLEEVLRVAGRQPQEYHQLPDQNKK